MNVMSMMNAMQNPQAAVMQYAMQGMIAQNPQQWQQAQQMFTGKSQKQQLNELRRLYKEKGMDLDATARQWGIQI